MRGWMAALLGGIALAGCATVRPAEPPAPGATVCHDGEYRGSFRSSAPGTLQRFRMSARLCPGGTALLEFRGVIGGAGLVAGVRAGQAVRLVFPTKHVVVDGPDAAWFWQKWTGAPLDGRLIDLLTASAGKSVTSGAWTADVGLARTGESLPASLVARDVNGHEVELNKTRERPAAAKSLWPDIPAGFDHQVSPATPPADVETAP